MKKKISVIVLIVLAAIFAISAVIVALRVKSDRNVEYDYQSDVESVAGYTDVIKFAGGTDFSPFCYIDENGNPCGHDIELAFAIGRELGCRVEITLGDWTEMQQGIADGTYDVLMTVDYSEERSKTMGYTSPICTDNYVFFAKDSGINPDDLKELKTLDIAALAGGGSTENYIEPLGLVGNTTYYDSQEYAFMTVANGKNDVAIAGYIYGSNIIAKENLDLVQVGSPLYGVAYYFTYNIENTALGQKLNTALAALDASGETDRISDKWTTHYQPSLTLAEYIGQNLQVFLMVGLTVFLVLLVVTLTVSASITRREKDMLEKNAVTGLYNGRAFLTRLELLLQKTDGGDNVLARFDLDNFKAFNRTQGTKAGDKLLGEIGKGLISQIEKKYDVLLTGYLGTDHFAIVINKSKLNDNPEKLYNDIFNVVHDSCPNYMLSIKMGLCKINEGSENVSKYCDRAYLALRSIKNNFYENFAWFDESIQKQLDEEKYVTDKMFDALNEGRFVPYFQPQYDYGTKKLIGAEALARWIEADGSILSPAKFIPVFEKNGFIYEMDRAIWRSVCRSIKNWKEQGIMPPHISVNISRSDIYHTNLVDTLKELTEEYGIDIKEIHFEITESAYMENGTILLDTINKLKAMGAYVEIDDFGSGYSSLSSLKETNVDLIKLDMSFLRNNTLTGKDGALLKSMVQIGKNLDIDIIAEGVEKPEQAEYLHSIGCDKMQGYLFSKPIDKETFEKLLIKEAKI